MPAPDPALAGWTVDNTKLDSGAITRPCPKPKIIRTTDSQISDGGLIPPTNATSECLDVNAASSADGANVQIWQYLSGNNQQWAFQAP